VFEVYVGGGDEGVKARALGTAYGLPRAQHVLFGRAAERGDRNLTALARDRADGLEVAVRGYREARLYHVNAQHL
jgi:hypothetical protein